MKDIYGDLLNILYIIGKSYFKNNEKITWKKLIELITTYNQLNVMIHKIIKKNDRYLYFI